jgi:hypothetical protein
MREQTLFQPGQTIIFHEMWQSKIWSARPEILVQDTSALRAFYLPYGTIWKRARSPEGPPATAKDRFQLSWILEDEV